MQPLLGRLEARLQLAALALQFATPALVPLGHEAQVGQLGRLGLERARDLLDLLGAVLDRLGRLALLLLELVQLALHLVTVALALLVLLLVRRELGRRRLELLAERDEPSVELLELALRRRARLAPLADLIAQRARAQLVVQVLGLDELVLQAQVAERLVLRSLEAALVPLQVLHAVGLLRPDLVGLVDVGRHLLEHRLVANRADDVLEVLEEALVVGVLGGRLGLEERDGLDLALQDEEAVVIEVDAALAQQRADLFVLDAPLVDVVVGGVVLAGGARHRELRARDDFERLVAAGWVEWCADLAEVDAHGARLDARVLLAVVDEDAELLGADLLGAEAEDEEQRVDHVRLARAVGPDDGVEALLNVFAYSIIMNTS